MTDLERATARRAFDLLCAAGEHGDWDALLALLTDDFEFLFPAGAHRARLDGPEGRAAFEAWARHKAHTSRSRKTLVFEDYGDTWAVFGVDSRGQDALGAFETHVALMFRPEGDRLRGYREYIGDIDAWT